MIKYKAKDEDGLWNLHLSKPSFIDGYWISSGHKSALPNEDAEIEPENSLIEVE